MLFAKKSKGFCVEIGEHATLLARLSEPVAPFLVEELKELPSTETENITAWTKGTDQLASSSESSTADHPEAANGTDTASATHSNQNRAAIVAISLSVAR